MLANLLKNKKNLLAAILIDAVILLILTFVIFENPVPSLKNSSYNMLFSWRGIRSPSKDIIIISIDDKSMEELGVFPWPRDLYGKIIEKLKADNAKVIGFDVEFANPGPVPEKDAIFAKAAKEAGNVFSVATFTVDNIVVGAGSFPYRKYNLPIKVLKNSIKNTGYTAYEMDGDGVVRKASLVDFLDDDKELARKSYKDARKVYSFAVAAVSMFTGRAEEQVIEDVIKNDVDYKRGVKGGDNTLLINFEGSPGAFKSVSFYRVLNGELPEGTFKDKIVLIGATSNVLHDEFLSPYIESGYMPGVEIHANVIDDLLKNEYLIRSGVVINYLVMLIFVALTLFFTSKFTPLLSAAFSMLLYGAFFFFALFLFVNQNYWLEISVPLISLGLTYVVNVGYRVITEGQKSRKMKGAFQRFVSRQVVDEIIKNGLDNLTVGGRKQKLVVFFSDIRNFTTMAERLAPEEVVEVLNFYFEEMTNIAFKYGGTVDKYIGDAIMVEFGAPLARPNDEELAVRMAIEMQEKMKELRDIWKKQGKEQFEIGCGINSGEAVVGFMGTERKMEYSALGDTVNIASRLESLTKEYHASIIISQSVYEQVKDIIEAKDLGYVSVKGKSVKVQIYDVLGLKK